ncbi:MAG: MarR family transcriptional regulator [Pseudomonadota bacterium]
MLRPELKSRFGFLVSDIARLHGRAFDKLARRDLNLSLAQVRVFCALATHGSAEGMAQHTLADHLDLSQMAVAALCARLETAGWVRRKVCAADRRARIVQLLPKAHDALAEALKLGDTLQRQALAALTAAERTEFLRLLQLVHGQLATPASA